MRYRTSWVEHLVRHLDGSAVHLVAALRDDQADQLFDGRDVRALEGLVHQEAGAVLAGRGGGRSAGRDGLGVEVGALGAQAEGVREPRQLQVAGGRQLTAVVHVGDLAALADADLGHAVGQRDLRLQVVALGRGERAGRVATEGTVPGEARLAVRELDLEEAVALDRDVEVVPGLGDRALHEHDAAAGDVDSAADLEAGVLLPRSRRRAGLAQRLVEERAELEVGPFEACGVAVRDVVRESIDLHLLGVHARGGGEQGAVHGWRGFGVQRGWRPAR